MDIRLPSLELCRGERWHLRGSSGAGKSSVLKAIAGLPMPGLQVRGEIQTNEKRVRVRLGRDAVYVAQAARAALDPGRTVRKQWEELAAMWSPTLSFEEAAAAFEFPVDHGTRTPRELSGGLATRAQLVLSAACPAPLWLVDEASSGLELSLRRRVLAAIDEFLGSEGVAIFAEHDRRAFGTMELQHIELRGGEAFVCGD